MFELHTNLSSSFAGDILVDGGVSFDVCAVYGDGAELEEFEFFGEFEHADKGLAEGIEVLAAKLADGVVIGMSVACEVTYGQVAFSGGLNLAGKEKTVGIAVDEQREHHVRRKLLGIGTTTIDLEIFEGKPVHGFNDEVDEIVFRNPISHVHG